MMQGAKQHTVGSDERCCTDHAKYPAGADLVEALSAKRIQTRIGAAYALGELRLEPKLAVRELSSLLGHDDQTVVREAA